MKIGITGQQGFMGSHLYNYLELNEENTLIPFERNYLSDQDLLTAFVQKCDVIIHLAAMNRHEDQNVIYKTNIDLVKKLIAACEKANHQPHIIFSSSSQEEKDNLYGNSKKEGREALEKWGERTGGLVSSLIIPNVFGPFGKPNYNSVVATFCHSICRGKDVTVNNDSNIQLIYINELIEEIARIIQDKKTGRRVIPFKHEISVIQLKDKLDTFKKQYIDNGVMPNLDSALDLALFNTFRCYVPHDHYPVEFTEHTDNRGAFVEIMRANTSGQFSFSTTVPGITRGNHFHTRKAERFAVIKGKAKIQLRKINTDEVIEYILDGEKPSYVDMPIWYTHNISNIGDTELLTLFWINEPYNPENADTYFIAV